MSATLMPLDEVVIRWSTTEQFEMRIPRARLLEVLSEDDELPDNLDELSDDEITDLFDSDELADREGNDDGNFIGTVDRSIDEVEIVRPVPKEFAHLEPGQRIRAVREYATSRLKSKTRIEWVGTLIAVTGSGLFMSCAPSHVDLSWGDVLEVTTVDDDSPDAKIVSAARD